MTTTVLVLHTADEIEDFCGDLLLTALVIGKGELGNKVLGIV